MGFGVRSTILYSAIQYCTLLYNTVLYFSLKYNTVLHSTLLQYKVQYSTIQYMLLLYKTKKIGQVLRRPLNTHIIQRTAQDKYIFIHKYLCNVIYDILQFFINIFCKIYYNTVCVRYIAII